MNALYWVSTLIVSGFLLLSSYTYLFSQNTIEGIRDLGFPDFFRIQLAILKIFAVLGLLLTQVPSYVKEWSYAGTGLFIITAMVAHIVHKDSIFILIVLTLLLLLLGLSRYSLPTGIN